MEGEKVAKTADGRTIYYRDSYQMIHANGDPTYDDLIDAVARQIEADAGNDPKLYIWNQLDEQWPCTLRRDIYGEYKATSLYRKDFSKRIDAACVFQDENGFLDKCPGEVSLGIARRKQWNLPYIYPKVKEHEATWDAFCCAWFKKFPSSDFWRSARVSAEELYILALDAKLLSDDDRISPGDTRMLGRMLTHFRYPTTPHGLWRIDRLAKINGRQTYVLTDLMVE